MSSLKQNRRYSKKNRKPFIPPPPPPFLFNSVAEQYLGEDRFRQLKKVRVYSVDIICEIYASNGIDHQMPLI